MEGNYKKVTTLKEIKEYLGNSKIIAFDFETAPDEKFRHESKAALDPAKSHVTDCSFSVKSGTGITVPLTHKVGKNMDQKVFWSFFAELMSDRTITKVAHNIAFESMMAYKKGIVIQAPVYDTMCGAQMTLQSDFEFRKLQDSGLKTLAGTVLNEALPTFETVTGGRHFDELSPDDAETIRYSAADADFALRLYYVFNEWFDKYLPNHRKIVEEIESPTAVYLGIMKYNGLPIDRRQMARMREEADKKIKAIHKEIEMMIGDVNIGANCSTKAFKDYLFADLGLPRLKTTATDRESTDDMTMTLLKEWCDKNRPGLSELFVLVQEYRKWQKIKTTYIDGYDKYINSVTNCIHPDLFALSTDTGRMNCRNPNAQNMPRISNDSLRVRDLIKAPDGHKIISCDFSQIELRVGAFYCRDEKMLETYRTGGDIHAQTTSVIFDIPKEQATDKQAPEYKERRTIAKNVNFGTFYGLYAKGLQRTLKFKAGIEKTLEECQEILDSLKAGYPKLAVWQKETILTARRNGYVETWLGRKRYLPDIRSDDWSKKSYAERCALNTPIQGTAADIIKLAITRILQGLAERPWLKPILQIHDELTFIVPDDRCEEAVEYIKACMEERPFPDFDLPLVAEASAGQSMGTLKEI